MKKTFIVFICLVAAMFVMGQTTYVKQKLPQIWVTDSDTLKIDTYKGLYALRFSLGGTDKFRADTAGNQYMTGSFTFTDNAWLGLASNAGRIDFDDQATDEVNILSAIVGIGTATPKATSLTLGMKGVQRDLLVTMENVPAGTDSSLLITASTLQPTIQFNGTDGDAYQISIDSSDQAKFKNASNGYIFDGGIKLYGTSATTGFSNQPVAVTASIANTNTTTNNTACLVFREGSAYTAAASVEALFVNHTSHYADIIFGTRAADGYKDRFHIESDGDISIGGAGTPKANSLTLGDKLRQIDLLVTREATPAGTDSSQLVTISTSGNVFTTYNGLSCIRGKISIADHGEYTLPASVAGWGRVQIGGITEWAEFRFTSAAAVTLEHNSTNVSTTADTDTKMNISDGGTTVVIDNELGSTLSLAYEIWYYTP
jgi:hypothetical protein